MESITIIDEDNNPIILDIPKMNGFTFREIATFLQHNHPFEYLLLLDQQSNQIISKYQKLECSSGPYRILQAQHLYQKYLRLCQENFPNQILILQQKIDEQKNFYLQQINQLKKEKEQLNQDKDNNINHFKTQITNYENQLSIIRFSSQNQAQMEQYNKQNQMQCWQQYNQLNQCYQQEQQKSKLLQIQIADYHRVNQEQGQEIIRKEEILQKAQQSLSQKEKEFQDLKDHLIRQQTDFSQEIQRLTSKIEELNSIKQDCQSCYQNQQKIQKLVESDRNPQLKQINFAIELIYGPEIQNIINHSEWWQGKYTLYNLQAQAFEQQNINCFSKIDYLDVGRYCSIKNAGQFNGARCLQEINAYRHSYDAIFLIRRNYNQKEVLYAVRYFNNQSIDERYLDNTAYKISIGLRISQIFLKQFKEELKQKGITPPDVVIQEPQIITTQVSFKEYLIRSVTNSTDSPLSKIKQSIRNMNDNSSNELFKALKDHFQLEKSTGQIHQQIDDLNQIFQFHNCDKNLILSEKEYKHFQLYFKDIKKDVFPVKEYYAAYQVEKLNEQKIYLYDDDHQQNNQTPIGSFLQAFSYYTIVRSQRQLCISRFKRVENILYDPLVSTYEGLLNRLDQGIYEIRKIESQIARSEPHDLGCSYLHMIGIEIPGYQYGSGLRQFEQI